MATRPRTRWVMLAALLLAGGVASASPITFLFTGVVDNDPFGVFDSATFAGSFTFDSAMPQVLATPQSGGYADSGGSVDMRVSFAGVLDPAVAGPYVADTLNITINNDFPGPLDQFLVTGTSSADAGLSIEIELDDFTGSAFSSTSLPLSAPDLAAFSALRFALFDGSVDEPVEAEGQVSSLRCVRGCLRVVPEPATAALGVLALGMLVLAPRARRASA